MTQEQKIKALLDSPNEQSQLLGCELAYNHLKWSNIDIMKHVLSSFNAYNLLDAYPDNFNDYEREFLGLYICFDPFCLPPFPHVFIHFSSVKMGIDECYKFYLEENPSWQIIEFLKFLEGIIDEMF